MLGRRALVAVVCCAGASCGGRPPPPQFAGLPPTARTATCAPRPEPASARGIYYGVVVDRRGSPIAGARISAAQWGYLHPLHWQRDPGEASATTDRNGHYQLALPLGVYRLRVDAGSRYAIWVHVRKYKGLVERWDLELDVDAEPGLTGVYNARVRAPYVSTVDCEWDCPIAPPKPEWWLGPNPCPAGARVETRVDETEGKISVACRLPSGREHGPMTTWHPGTTETNQDWVERNRWYRRGTACPSHEPVGPLADPGHW